MSTVVGIDLGASTSYVGYISKGVVDIVQNEVSQRATSTMVGFKNEERHLGDEALAQVKGNAKNTCRNFKHLLGQTMESPEMETEKFWSTSSLETAEDGFVGYNVTHKGESKTMSASQITAAFLSKLRDISEAWSSMKVTDAVISVPSYYSDIQRQALLDATKIAGIPVLCLMNEHTAIALGYGIYRARDFDETKPMIVAFCSVGHTTFSVTVAQFTREKVVILSEKSAKIGGRDMDKCLMETFAAQFEKKHGMNPLSNKKSAFKLEEAVVKTKKVLSANNEAPINVECLMEDEDFASTIKREDVEAMCAPLMETIKKVLDEAIKASGVAPEEIESVEMVGGASRVPFVKQLCAKAFGETREPSFTLNADEAVARGCALQAAILSPLYKVREYGLEETTPYGVSIGWQGVVNEKEQEDGAAEGEEAPPAAAAVGDSEVKWSVMFPESSRMNTSKAVTMFRKEPFEIMAQYVESAPLMKGTPKTLGTYRIELPPCDANKKVKVKAKLNLSGVFSINEAEIIEEERYEEVTKEKREVVPAESDASPETTPEVAAPEAATAEPAAADAEKKEVEEKKEEKPAEKKEPEKKYEWVEVKKMKKRTKRTDVPITKIGTPGVSDALIQKFMDVETQTRSEMREIRETDERRNDLEGYIFLWRDKVGGEAKSFISSSDADKFLAELQTAEDWLYDTYDATKVQYIEKLSELKKTGDVVAWRQKEKGMRQDWIDAVNGTVNNFMSAAKEPGTKYDHIAPEKLKKIVDECTAVKTWLDAAVEEQAKTADHEKPALMCTEMETRNTQLAKMADEILKERKPAPPVEEKAEEKEKKAEVPEATAPEAKKEDGKNITVDDVD